MEAAFQRPTQFVSTVCRRLLYIQRKNFIFLISSTNNLNLLSSELVEKLCMRN